MKLILANNQSDKFLKFYENLNKQSAEPFDYAGYSSLIFSFTSQTRPTLEVINLKSGKNISQYSGVYINGYLNSYELAVAVAITCNKLGIKYANHELESPPSLSKLSMYAKLASKDVPIPSTIAGTKVALINYLNKYKLKFDYPLVLKRADADRGIDNYKVSSNQEVIQLLEPQAERSLWVLQEFIANRGFYLISFYNSKPTFCIFRRLENRPDKDLQKAHMYKPKGGANASLIEIADAPKSLIQVSTEAIKAMNRQIASVDCLYDEQTDEVRVLEVNYNPQLVTIETFKDVRIKAFLDNLPSLGYVFT